MWRYIDMFSSRPQLAETWSIMMLPIGIAADGIVAVADPRLAAAETHVADDDVVRFEFDRVAGDADAVARGGAAGDGDVRRADADAVLELDDAGDIEDDDARSAGFERFAEAARAAVVEIGDDEHLAAAPAEAVHAAALRAGEGGNRRLRQILGLRGPRDVRLALRGPSFDRRLGLLPDFIGAKSQSDEFGVRLFLNFLGNLGIRGLSG